MGDKSVVAMHRADAFWVWNHFVEITFTSEVPQPFNLPRQLPILLAESGEFGGRFICDTLNHRRDGFARLIALHDGTVILPHFCVVVGFASGCDSVQYVIYKINASLIEAVPVRSHDSLAGTSVSV